MQPFSFLRIVSYLPIPLCAENLRVRRALIDSISSYCSIPPALTGCVRDLGELWEVQGSNLFEIFSKKNYNVVSLRHGNSFQMANRSLLESTGVIGSPDHSTPGARHLQPDEIMRLTTVNVNFVTPAGLPNVEAKGTPPTWLTGVCQAIILLEVILEISIGAVMGMYGMFDGSVLMGCMAINHLVLSFLQRMTTIVFGTTTELMKDSKKTAADGAALDVQIISTSWNSTHLDVLIGYSSQLHGLTNLCVAARPRWMIAMACRLLSIVLLLQAAVLTSILGSPGVEVFVPLIWLAVYTLTQIPPACIRYVYPNIDLAQQPATVFSAGTFHFTRRRSALAFIAMFPVSPKAPRWDWLNVFMPNNERRQDWQKDLETDEIIAGKEPEARTIPASTRVHLEEATHARNTPKLSQYLAAYKETVRAH